MIVRTMISFPWVVLSYSNDSKESLLSHTDISLLFYDVDVELDLAWELDLLEMESDDKLQPVSQ